MQGRFWYDKKLIWPLNSVIETPMKEMPDDIKELYIEASNILELSPKGEKTYMEPCLKYGHGYIHALKEALAEY